MTTKRTLSLAGRGLGLALGMAAASYAAWVGATWFRFGRPPLPKPDAADALLELFMPVYDVVERHEIDVFAPADVTFGALMDMSLEDSAIIRAIFKARKVLLGADAAAGGRARSLVDVTQELGWVVLADVPGHEIVMGAVTQPWKANVEFRGIPSEQFAAFNEPGYVKIVWTLRADGAGPNSSIARSETRVIATDAEARRKFRWYWARFSPGIALIREISLRLVRKDAEMRAHQAQRGNGKSTEMVVPPVGGSSI